MKNLTVNTMSAMIFAKDTLIEDTLTEDHIGIPDMLQRFIALIAIILLLPVFIAAMIAIRFICLMNETMCVQINLIIKIMSFYF